MDDMNEQNPQIDNTIEIENALPEVPSMTVQDLFRVKEIIDVAASRGTFKTNELKNVGEIYEKLDNFLNYVASQAREAEANKGES